MIRKRIVGLLFSLPVSRRDWEWQTATAEREDKMNRGGIRESPCSPCLPGLSVAGAVSLHITFFQSLRNDSNLGAKRRRWCFYNSFEYLKSQLPGFYWNARFVIITFFVSLFYLKFSFPSGLNFPKECDKRRAMGYIMLVEEGPGPRRIWLWRWTKGSKGNRERVQC